MASPAGSQNITRLVQSGQKIANNFRSASQPAPSAAQQVGELLMPLSTPTDLMRILIGAEKRQDLRPMSLHTTRTVPANARNYAISADLPAGPFALLIYRHTLDTDPHDTTIRMTLTIDPNENPPMMANVPFDRAVDAATPDLTMVHFEILYLLTNPLPVALDFMIHLDAVLMSDTFYESFYLPYLQRQLADVEVRAGAEG